MEEEPEVICFECGNEISDMEHNYGTPEMPVCMQCHFWFSDYEDEIN